jgi:hypothetical protein
MITILLWAVLFILIIALPAVIPGRSQNDKHDNNYFRN